MKCFTHFVFAGLVFAACSFASGQGLILYPAPEGAPLSDAFTVLVNEQEVDLYATETRWGSTASYGYFDFEGEVEIQVIAKYPPPHSTDWQVLPAKFGVKPEVIRNGQIKFKLADPANLTFVVMGDYQGRTLHLFAGAPEQEVPDKNDPNVIWFGPGYHEVGTEKDWTIDLKSNQTLYIAGGAYVKGYVNAEDAENITIMGRGILGQFSDMPRKRSLVFKEVDGLDINGIICNRNYIGWSGVIINSENIHINNYKVFSTAIWSTDGLNLVNSGNATYTNCFFRCGDDNIAIKGMGASGRGGKKEEDPNTGLPNEKILVEGCIFWSDNNNAVVIGQETKADYYADITFRDCDVLFVRDEEPIKAAMAIICNNGTDFRNITFEDIRVGPSGQLITVFFSEVIFGIPGSQEWPGGMENIVFRNIEAWGAGSKEIRIEGWSPDKLINGISLENVKINGEMLSEEARYLKVNEHVKNLVIK